MTPAIRTLAKAMATAKTPEDVSLIAEAMEAAMRIEAEMAGEAHGNVAASSGRATGRRPHGMPISSLRPPPEPAQEPQAGGEA